MLVSYTFEVEDKVKDRIQEIADLEHRSLASQMRIALEKYIESLN